MRFVVVLTFLFGIFHLTLGQIRTAGFAIGGSISGRAVKTKAEICTDKTNIGKSYCNGDATCESNSVVICTSATDGITIQCTADKPNCVSSSGKVSCSASSECRTGGATFECTGVGYYPDPSNCKMYYNCHKDTEGNIKAEATICPSGYVFGPNSVAQHFCLYTSSPSKCVTVTGCDAATTTKNVPINFSNNALFVALCIPAVPPLIFQCPKGTKANLDDIPVSCTYICKSQGQFEYTPDKYFYYDCKFDSAKKLYSELKSCPAGFNKTICVRT